MTWRAAVLAALCSTACTFEDGTGFGSLESGTLSVELRPGAARDLGDRTVLSDLGYHVRLETARIGIGSVVLSEISSGSNGGGTFDPADPPPGYGLCHAGHCHHEDGRLVAYEEIEAELAGGGAAFVPIATLPLETELDLWSTEPAPLGARELPRTSLRRLSVGVTHFELSGSVSQGDLASERALSVALPLDASFEKSIELVIDRDEPGEFSLAIDVHVSARLIDGVDFAAIAGSPLTDPEDPRALLLTESLLASELSMTVH